MKIGLVISNDWELFGNGTGDYFDIQHQPLAQLLDTIDHHGAKLTVMAEIGQQWAHQRVAEHERWAQDITLAWESILQDTIRRGSDVQLHLHPQWLNATYDNRQWVVDRDRIKMSSLPEQEMESVLRRGKIDLETLCKPIDHRYECLAFRSGWYCMQPSRVVTKNLLKTGFLCDTSVVPGTYEDNLYDYRRAHSNCAPWFADADDVQYQSAARSGVLEIPICAYESTYFPLLSRLQWTRLYNLLSFGTAISKEDAAWLIERDAMENRRRRDGGSDHILHAVRSRSTLEKIKRYLSRLLIAKRSFRLDYDNLAPNTFVTFVQRVVEAQGRLRQRSQSELILPIVASGHVKRMLGCDNINRILDKMNTRFKDRIVHWTLSEATRYYLDSMRLAVDAECSVGVRRC